MWSWGRIRGEVRRFWQRRTWGWDESDCWSLDHTFAEWIVPRLELLKKNKQGFPGWCFEDPFASSHTDEEMDFAEKAWDYTLDEMIRGFNAKKTEYNWDVCSSEFQQYELAKELFAKHLDDLWD